MKRHWKLLQPNYQSIDNIQKFINCSPITAAILANRNIVSESELSSFFNTSLNNLRSPFTIKDMDVAVRRIYEAIIRREKILVFGDYDADGITATVILFEFLRHTGTDVSYYIPHRIVEGYGLQKNHIPGYAVPNQIRLIITTDCGSTSHDAITAARDAGIDVIVTDHHNISGPLPGAAAVVNPKRADCHAGFEMLAGVGVAFCLIICLRKYLRDRDFWKTRQEPNLKNICDLVSLGTIADMVPLIRENRILSKTGLEIINSGKRVGIIELLKACRIATSSVDTDDIAFRLAPRINAAGRMDHGQTAMQLLTASDSAVACPLAQTLNRLNKDRQDAEKQMFKAIADYINSHPALLQNKTLVVSGSDWHEGILGIVASRIVERYYRPAVLISTKNGFGKGSGRSIPGVNLYKGLTACSNDLMYFGGHSMAAGLKIRTEQIHRFHESFEDVVRRMASDDVFVPVTLIDYQLDFDEISDVLLDELESLKPFGAGNPEPMFIAEKVSVVSSKIVGEHHRRMVLRQPYSNTRKLIEAIQFNINKTNPLPETFDRMVFRLRWNRWNGRTSPQIVIEETAS